MVRIETIYVASHFGWGEVGEFVLFYSIFSLGK